MKLLITGVAGFVGHHCIEYFSSIHPEIDILGTDLVEASQVQSGLERFTYRKVDLLDKAAIRYLFTTERIDSVLHLASFSSVAFSWERPADSFLNNSLIFINLIEAVKAIRPECRMLSIGSSEEYGDVTPSELPLAESHALKPRSPYGVARISQEMLSEVFCSGYGLDIVMTRSFNHIGPFQRDNFVIPAFVRQFVQAEREGKSVVHLKVGDVDVVRDFTDVRDVVRAYDLLLQKGKKGEVYNVCSGMGYKLRDIIGHIENLMSMRSEIETDSNTIRPLENREIVGNNAKIRKDCGWQPERSIESSLADVIEYWRSR